MFIVTVVSSLAFVSSPPLSLVQRVIMLARQFCGYDYANMLTLCVCECTLHQRECAALFAFVFSAACVPIMKVPLKTVQNMSWL